MRILNRDFAAGAFFVILGLSVTIGSTGMRMGQLNAMGPGFLPFWLGLLLAAFGAVVLAGSIFDAQAERLEAWNVKGLMLLTASVLLFGLLLEPMGVAVSVFAVVLVSGLASREFSLVSSLLTAAVLAAGSIVVFRYGLGIPLPVWPSFMVG